jgi:hypothetical protein
MTIAMSMILARTLSMPRPLVRQSCAIRRLVEIRCARVPALALRRSPEWPICKIRIDMSEYPGTGINKAVLKFARQDLKKSQIVSVIISIFFVFNSAIVAGTGAKNEPGRACATRIPTQIRLPRKLPYEAYTPAANIILAHNPVQKNLQNFFQVIFIFLLNLSDIFLFAE